MSGFGFNEDFNKFHQELWLKNQELAVIPYVGLISMLNDPENPLPLMHKSLNDIETSINLSYQESDAGETP